MAITELKPDRRAAIARCVETVADGGIAHLIKKLAEAGLYRESGLVVDVHTRLMDVAREIGGDHT
jgi:hypothetical protein